MITLPDEKKDLICRAITERHLVQFMYNGRSRIVEPFCCGIGTTGNYVLRGFQVRGSDKTKPLCWRLYELAEMSQMSITQHSFKGNRQEYSPEDSAITEIFCRIE
jgi:hypothetical protein